MAPVLKDGIYEIRFVPRFILPPIIGGSYATGGSINDPIRAEALSPEVHGNQTWEVKCVPGKENIFTISHPKFINTLEGIGPVLPGFGLSQVADKETVVLSVDIKHITVPVLMVDTVQAITEENQLLYVDTFIVGRAIPRWEFIPVKN